MSVARLSNESGAHTAARQALWAAEVALKEQRERVAELRRALPWIPWRRIMRLLRCRWPVVMMNHHARPCSRIYSRIRRNPCY